MIHKSGLAGFVSADGLRWRKVQPAPVFPAPREFAFDSQNIAFWSEAEGQYVLYYRTWKKVGETNYRWVSRAVSGDFRRWRTEGEMEFGAAPPEHLYTNQTAAYFRAPHIYVGLAARFFPGRQVLTPEQAAAVGVDPRYYRDCSDAVLLSSRGGLRYTRTFLESYLRPGPGLENWVSRSNYPALNLIPTGKSRMSFFVNCNYGQPGAEARRYELRLDGFASLHAGYTGGEMVTLPFQFGGSRLELNYSTSAAGFVRVELQDENGAALPGYGLSEARELIGDEIAGGYGWKAGASVAALRGKPVRMRVVLKDADLYSFCFGS